MPKEVIYSRDEGRLIHTPTGTAVTLTDEPRVHIGWSAEGEHVEVAVLNPKGDPNGGWYCQMDRHGINRLIRTLRKARDQAFGSDA